MGLGFLLWVGSIGVLSWKFGYLVPYTYGMFHYLREAKGSRAVIPDTNIYSFAVGYFILLTALSLFIYLSKQEKG